MKINAYCKNCNVYYEIKIDEITIDRSGIYVIAEKIEDGSCDCNYDFSPSGGTFSEVLDSLVSCVEETYND